MRLEIDSPPADAVLIGGDVAVSGWAYARAGIVSLEVSLNHRTMTPPTRGLLRSDVAVTLEQPAATDVGWRLELKETDLREGQNSLRVTARAPGLLPRRVERRFSWRRVRAGDISRGPVDFTREPYEPRDGRVDSIAAEHRARYRIAATLVGGRRVLDAGCGLGYGADTLLSAGAVSVDALDSNAVAVAVAARDADPSVRFMTGDVRQLPYADASFDVVVCFGVLEHLPDYDQAIEELRRVLAPTGLVMVSMSNPGRAPAQDVSHAGDLAPHDLAAVLGRSFEHVALLCQQSHVATIIGDGELLQHADDHALLTMPVLKLSGAAVGTESFNVVVATNGTLPLLEPIVALAETRDDRVEAAIGSWRQRAVRAEAETAALRQRLELTGEGGQGQLAALLRPLSRFRRRSPAEQRSASP